MEKHYHYLIGYSFEAPDRLGFGDMAITTSNKINNIIIDSLRKKVLESAKEQDSRITNAVIISIYNLECGCENEENLK